MQNLDQVRNQIEILQTKIMPEHVKLFDMVSALCNSDEPVNSPAWKMREAVCSIEKIIKMDLPSYLDAIAITSSQIRS